MDIARIAGQRPESESTHSFLYLCDQYSNTQLPGGCLFSFIHNPLRAARRAMAAAGFLHDRNLSQVVPKRALIPFTPEFPGGFWAVSKNTGFEIHLKALIRDIVFYLALCKS